MRMRSTFFGFLLLFASFADAALPSPHSVSTSPPGLPNTDRLPGVDLADGISQITGAAVSPLLGVSSIGAWRYYHTPEHLRDHLPWFCSPAVWGVGFGILGLCFLKDAFGTVMPPLIKKPFDMAELFENKASALVASTAFAPFVAAQIAQHLSDSSQARASPLADIPLASVVPIGSISVDLRLLLIPLSIVTFLIVWMTSHAINVLIALCPFGFIDAILKLFKTGIMCSIVLAYIISPYLGAAVSLVIIFIAALFAPLAFRFAVFGTMFGSDILFGWRARRAATPAEAHAFISRRMNRAPRWTYGRLNRSADGRVQFTYRPWLVFSCRSVDVPSGLLSVEKGALFPSLLHSGESAGSYARILVFLPRYRRHEGAIASHLQADVRDGSLAKGFKAVRQWFTEIFSSAKSKISELQTRTNE